MLDRPGARTHRRPNFEHQPDWMKSTEANQHGRLHDNTAADCQTELIYFKNIRINATTVTPSIRAAEISIWVLIVPLASG